MATSSSSTANRAGPLGLALVTPARVHLASYAEALARGWSPSNVNGEAVRVAELAAIGHDPDAFVRSLDDPDAKGPPLLLGDGTVAARLPGVRLWMWDGVLCGSIGLRWSPGTEALPVHVHGHIGYSVVPWKRRLGVAARALALMLPHARARGLRFVDLVADTVNAPSVKVILANGGCPVGQFEDPHDAKADAMLYRIDLSDRPILSGHATEPKP